ncbi:hypothetical protein [Thioalkalivibrio sp. ALMg9]|uniref:hypothetical protein n=1 Tax=Thioalkalivibrio sp. ALMg9 TaxID=1266912 RepID=UPI0003820EA4|nr:hypothetical protein [Thioalkalivibrio sp. ALMg9]
MKSPFLFFALRHMVDLKAAIAVPGITEDQIRERSQLILSRKHDPDAETQDMRGDIEALVRRIGEVEATLDDTEAERLRASIDDMIADTRARNAEPQERKILELDRRLENLAADMFEADERVRRAEQNLAKANAKVEQADRRKEQAVAALPTEDQRAYYETQKLRIDAEAEQAMLDELKTATSPGGR